MTIGETWRNIQADIDAFARDAATWKEQRGRWRESLSAALTPQVSCVIIFRLAHYFHRRGLVKIAGLIGLCNHLLFRIHLHPSCSIGPGLVIPHPGAIVVQADAGKSLRLSAGATVFGDRICPLLGRRAIAFPRLGDNCTLGARCRVIGAVRIGSNCIVGFSTLVTEDMADNATAMPARFRNQGLPPPCSTVHPAVDRTGNQ